MKTSASAHLLPFDVEQLLRHLGARVSIARRTRQLTAADLAAKAGISLRTLSTIERGGSTVQIGYWMSVLWALDMLDELEPLARAGRNALVHGLLEAQLPQRVRYKRPKKVPASER